MKVIRCIWPGCRNLLEPDSYDKKLGAYCPEHTAKVKAEKNKPKRRADNPYAYKSPPRGSPRGPRFH